jgi:hypothetical protein
MSNADILASVIARSVIPGARVQYTGDVCNAPKTGTITATYTNRWGSFAVVRWDCREMIGWERDGTAVTWQGEFFQEVPIHLIKQEPQPGYRFHLLPEGSEA